MREALRDHLLACLASNPLATDANSPPNEWGAPAPTPPTAQHDSHKAETMGEQIDLLCDECLLTTATRPTEHTREGTRPGDPALLGDKHSVNFLVAEAYLGVSERQRQRLIKKNVLEVTGQGTNRRITTESLRRYLPPKDPT